MTRLPNRFPAAANLDSRPGRRLPVPPPAGITVSSRRVSNIGSPPLEQTTHYALNVCVATGNCSLSMLTIDRGILSTADLWWDSATAGRGVSTIPYRIR
jgi:hypothetical protein